MVRNNRVLVAVAAFGLMASACTVKKAERPPLAGPSELALSLTVTASPDILAQDGSSQSRVVILARDQNGDPVRALPLHLDITVNGSVVAYGRLSSQDVSTGNDGRATLTYTPPPATTTTDTGAVVTIQVTPIGTDYANSLPRSVTIRLVPPGYLPPPPVASFTFSPVLPVPNSPVSFDGSGSSCETATIVTYEWDFGDGSTATGKTASHTYRATGNYNVALLVTDDSGRTSTPAVQSVVVGAAVPPTASFVTSPTSPGPGQTLYLNASSSTAGAGRRLVSYDWDFGNGARGTGVTTTVTYAAGGSYTITLVVTDDVGQTATKSASIQVTSSSAAPPTAAFIYSPTPVRVGQPVNFDASSSTAGSGLTLVSYDWSFGDASPPGAGQTISHTFATAATYTVRLTVTDSSGRTATIIQTVTVTP